MTMRNRLLTSISALLMCCAVVTLGSPALAQNRDANFRVQFGPDVQRMVRQAGNRTSRLAAMLDQKGLEGLSARARDLESQLNMVEQQFDDSSRYGRRSQVASALRVAESINNAMRYRRVDRVDYDVQRAWSMVRNDLNRLARVYNLRQI